VPRCFPRPIALISLAALGLAGPPALAACTSPAEVVDPARNGARPAQAFDQALPLVECLGHPDPQIRDQIAFTRLATLLRQGQWTPAQLRELRARLEADLQAEDRQGYRRPFLALVLAEVARTDRIQPWMLPAERTSMAAAAAAYLASVRDYRGYEDGEGWRHGVAHGADWIMQLALNPQVDLPARTRMLAAIASQVSPADGSSYRFGEPSRLARASYFLLASAQVEPAWMQEWLREQSSSLGPMPKGPARSAWWIQRNNLEAFLNALAAVASQGGSAAADELKHAAHQQLRQLP
jgi:hypothetical protein